MARFFIINFYLRDTLRCYFAYFCEVRFSFTISVSACCAAAMVDFFARALHSRTAVARLPLRQLGFLVVVVM